MRRWIYSRGTARAGSRARRSPRPPACRAPPSTAARRRREPTTTALQRAKARGQLPRSSDIELLVDVFAGVMFYHLVLGGPPPEAGYVKQLADVVVGKARATN